MSVQIDSSRKAVVIAWDVNEVTGDSAHVRCVNPDGEDVSTFDTDNDGFAVVTFPADYSGRCDVTVEGDESGEDTGTIEV